MKRTKKQKLSFFLESRKKEETHNKSSRKQSPAALPAKNSYKNPIS